MPNCFITLYYRGYSKGIPKTHERERLNNLSCEKPPPGHHLPVYRIILWVWSYSILIEPVFVSSLLNFRNIEQLNINQNHQKVTIALLHVLLHVFILLGFDF